MAKQNFLLGKGERLTDAIVGPSGGGPKSPPYTFEEAKTRLVPMLSRTVEDIYSLPDEACPGDRVVVSMTLNPEYLAKSYFPAYLLHAAATEVVGSRAKKVVPEKRSRNRVPEEAITAEIFVAGRRSDFRDWSRSLPHWTGEERAAEDLIKIEQIEAKKPEEKLKGFDAVKDTGSLFELVMHSDELTAESRYLRQFTHYLDTLGVEPRLGRRFYAGGLCFMELEAPADRIADVAAFSLLRTVRPMPRLRMLRPTIRGAEFPSVNLALPASEPVDKETRVAVFDGGVPKDHPITAWVNSRDADGVGTPDDELYFHGVTVTSALLFGPIDQHKPISRPYTYVDHYRVIDTDPSADPYELYEVLDRIDQILSRKQYDFVNLSLGPRLPIEDDEVHAWTAVIDERLSRSSILATIAVGNDGASDAALGLNRIQVPSDCVNALSVGSCDSPEGAWSRASYSSVGPGRSPGLVKPDLVDFGGDIGRPFLAVGIKGTELDATGGTSFAAPSVLRLATGVRAHFGSELDPLTIKTLLIHTSENGDSPRTEIGWGRVARSLDDIVLCGDDTIRVVYQGEISPSKWIRAPIPLPDEQIPGMASLNATLCYSCDVDPHHPCSYTRAGLEVAFRPNAERFQRPEQVHANTTSFFGSSSIGLSEEELRRDAWKWENCLHASRRFRGSSLNRPCFDIHYLSRLEGHAHQPPGRLRYSLIVTVQARNLENLYDKVLRKYATQLEPLLPVVEIPIRT